MLRCTPRYNSTVLSEHDDVIRHTLKAILNVDLSDVIWKQATLSVSSGGLGVRLATDLALPALLSSVNGASLLTLRHKRGKFPGFLSVSGTVIAIGFAAVPLQYKFP